MLEFLLNFLMLILTLVLSLIKLLFAIIHYTFETFIFNPIGIPYDNIIGYSISWILTTIVLLLLIGVHCKSSNNGIYRFICNIRKKHIKAKYNKKEAHLNSVISNSLNNIVNDNRTIFDNIENTLNTESCAIPEEVMGDILEQNEMFKLEYQEALSKQNNLSENAFNTYNELLRRKEIKHLSKIDNDIFNNLNSISRKYNSISNEFSNIVDSIKHDLNRVSKGINGEITVSKELKMFEHRYKILSNLLVEVEGKTAETDFMIISNRGIFAIEVKNYGRKGDNLIIEDDGIWTIEKQNGDIQSLKSPVAQNNWHCSINEILLNKELQKKGISLDGLEINTIIVIANDDITLTNKGHNTVIRASEIVNTIQRYPINNELTATLQDTICCIFEENNRPAKKYPYINRLPALNSKYNKLNELNELMTTLIPILNTILDRVNKADDEYDNK